MRLVGFAYGPPNSERANSGARVTGGPLRRGYLALADVTGIVGANDTGKTQLLKRVSKVLQGRDEGIFFAACTREEYSAINAHALSDVAREKWGNGRGPESRAEASIRAEKEFAPTPGDRSSWWDGPSWAMGHLDVEGLEEVGLKPEQDPITGWKQAILGSVQGQRDDWDAILSAASGEHDFLLALEPTQVPELRFKNVDDEDALMDEIFPAGSAAGWNLFWCLPPYDELDNGLQDAVRTCGIRESPNDPADLWEARSVNDVRATVEHRLLRRAPILVAPLGRSTLPLLPNPIQLPSESDQVRKQIDAAIGNAVSTTRYADRLLSDEVSLDYFGVEQHGSEPGESEGSSSPIEADDAWTVLNNRTGRWRLHPDVWIVKDELSDGAQRRLPEFLRRLYRLKFLLRGYRRHPSLEVRLEAKARSDEQIDVTANDPAEITIVTKIEDFLPEETSFQIDGAAEGYKVWLQLALLATVQDARARISELQHVTSEFRSSGIDFLIAEADEAEAELLDGWRREFSASRERLEQVLQAYRKEAPPTSPSHHSASDLRILEDGQLTREKAAGVDLLRPTIYVIDEPERHLHPRLQREAASWLGDVTRDSNAQILLATHSLPFMDMSGASYTYLRREGSGPALLSPLDPQTLSRLDDAADVLGLNRGELMTLVKVFLWVEGPMDKVVLEALFPTELREFGVTVTPLSGHSRASALLDAPLLEFTEAKIAVWLDNIPGSFLAKLREDPEFARSAAVTEKVAERKTLAKLVVQAMEQEKEVHPVGSAPHEETHAGDVFDLLDEGAIEDLFPEYPGHAQAHDIWEEAVKNGRPRGQRKDFWASEFRTPITVESCTRIAERMRERGDSAPELLSVIESCERLALEVR